MNDIPPINLIVTGESGAGNRFANNTSIGARKGF